MYCRTRKKKKVASRLVLLKLSLFYFILNSVCLFKTVTNLDAGYPLEIWINFKAM